MKAQSALEFMITYSWAFLIIALFVATVLVMFVGKNPASYSPQACYIQPALPCYQSMFMSNSTASTFVVMFSNNLGPRISFASNAMMVRPTVSGSSRYYGECLPANAPEGASIICNATLSGYSAGIGSQINPGFQLSYQICQPTCATYNTSGSSSNLVAAYKKDLAIATLLTNTGSGGIAIAGAGYPSNTNIYLIVGKSYTAYAVPPSGYIFGNWLVSGNIAINSTTSQLIQVTATGAGTLTADFIA